MQLDFQKIIDISDTPAARRAQVNAVLDRARWASQAFQRYDREMTLTIAEAVANAAYAKAAEYGEWAVRETGFGVAEHKTIKNQMTSRTLFEHYRAQDFVNPRIDGSRKIVEIPRPAGVIFALTPSTNPIATVYFKVIAALLTRNAIVLSPHPAARECCTDAANMLAQAAEGAGAPSGAIQVVSDPSIPLIEEFMRSEKTNVVLATGGNAMVRSAYSSSNPAIGVGPGNAPAFVDGTADLRKAARYLVESKSFDNSVLCTNESVLITVQENDGALRKELRQAGAHVCSEQETNALRNYLFHNRGFNVEAVGRDARWIAVQAGFKTAPKVSVLVTPITRVGFAEPLSKEKLCPVLGYYVASSVTQAITQARALLRMAGAGHTAVIHSGDAATAMDYAAAVETYRVVVNAPASQGASGFATHLPPTFTIGTGYFGRSAIGDNIGPAHLIQWTRLAYNKDDSEAMGDYSGLGPRFSGPIPTAPADGVPGSARRGANATPIPRTAARPMSAEEQSLRENIRRIIVEELRSALRK
ncbi:MAG: aldehyde dehydrogenase family protein [Gammaproteobacteria bacterium]|nr:aldehyde dehydrogenase family protein [Gammaproteobacteria bacterium]